MSASAQRTPIPKPEPYTDADGVVWTPVTGEPRVMQFSEPLDLQRKLTPREKWRVEWHGQRLDRRHKRVWAEILSGSP